VRSIRAERLPADVDGEFAVFPIGMRVNRSWKPHRWPPVALAMGRMLRELEADPAAGLLGVGSWTGRTSIPVQPRGSCEALEAYATDAARENRPAWAAFDRAIGSNGDVGIWHETDRARPGDFEGAEDNVPLFGLAEATPAVAATGRREFAPGRMAAVEP
jgi:hypothetical protein